MTQNMPDFYSNLTEGGAEWDILTSYLIWMETMIRQGFISKKDKMKQITCISLME